MTERDNDPGARVDRTLHSPAPESTAGLALDDSLPVGRDYRPLETPPTPDRGLHRLRREDDGRDRPPEHGGGRTPGTHSSKCGNKRWAAAALLWCGTAAVVGVLDPVPRARQYVRRQWSLLVHANTGSTLLANATSPPEKSQNQSQSQSQLNIKKNNVAAVRTHVPDCRPPSCLTRDRVDALLWREWPAANVWHRNPNQTYATLSAVQLRTCSPTEHSNTSVTPPVVQGWVSECEAAQGSGTRYAFGEAYGPGTAVNIFVDETGRIRLYAPFFLLFDERRKNETAVLRILM